MKRKQYIYIVATSVMTVGGLYFMDQVLELSYLSKIMVKLFFFALFPLIYIKLFRDNVLKDSLGKVKGKFRFKLSHLLGILILATILLVYQWVKGYMDIEVLVAEFEDKYRIHKGNIVYYGLYLSFANSLLEEFFFRGFMFLNLKKIGKKSWAYGLSAVSFAVYHISNFQNWFNIGLVLLALLGLTMGGLIFNFLDDREDSFLHSWFVHICADLAIVWIGLDIFGIV